MLASEKAGRELSPCDIEIPADWDVRIAQDDLLVSVIAEAPCNGSCRNPPAITMSIALGPNPNADAREAVWPEIMSAVGGGRCGDGVPRFFSTSDLGSGGPTGGLRFHLTWNDLKYDGSTSFRCDSLNGWRSLQDLFLDTFRRNPGSTFPRP